MPRMFRVKLVSTLIAMAALLAMPAGALAKELKLSVLSSSADQVSGGDALVRVDAPVDLLNKLQVLRNGQDVTGSFERQGDALVGLVSGFSLGQNELSVRHNRKSNAPVADRLTIVNYPTEGPIFSGPHQVPFVCKTIQAGLGEPLVDNQAGQGFRVLNPDGTTTAGWSLDCSANTRVDYLYRTTGGQFAAAPRRRLAAGQHGRRRRCRTAAPSTTSSAASAARSTASSTPSPCSRRSSE